MDSRGWTAFLDLRDQRAKLERKETGVNQVEMAQEHQVHRALLDHRDKSSTRRQAVLMVLLAAPGLRVDLVYLGKLDSLVLLDQRGTEETPAPQATG